MITPTVGRVVYYKAYGTPGGEFPSIERAAIITDVKEVIVDDNNNEHEFPLKENVIGFNELRVRLAVLNPTGIFFSDWLKNGEKPGQWDWMPFQKNSSSNSQSAVEK